jgi:hypothetical protein
MLPRLDRAGLYVLKGNRFMRMRLAVFASILLAGLAAHTPAVFASAEFHRMNIVFSAVPTEVRAGDFNDLIAQLNDTRLRPNNLEPVDKISLAWLLDGEMRYFARQNLAVNVGVSRIRAGSQQEYLPTIGASNTVQCDITSVPIHLGAAYYFTPYNQGDFQARAYLGGGFMSVVYNRAAQRWIGNGIPAPGGFSWTGTNDGPGYYAEAGVHMFFASKLSVLLSALLRSNDVRHLVDEQTGAPILGTHGQPISLDVSGAGFRMAVGIGL